MASMNFPFFVTTVIDQANPEVIYKSDLTAMFQSLPMVEGRRLLERLATGKAVLTRHRVYPMIPDELKYTHISSAFPTLTADAAQFIEEIGGLDGFEQWREIELYRQRLTDQLDHCASNFEAIRNATFVRRELNTFDMLSQADGERYGSLDDLCESYAAGAPIPLDSDASDSDWQQHQIRSSEWARQNCTPYAWSTVERPWAGFTLETFRQIMEEIDEGDVDAHFNIIREVRDYIDNDLTDNHHEDASGQIVDLAELDAIILAWYRGDSSTRDAPFKKALAEWNSKQTITTYFEQTNTAVSLWHGLAKKDCVDHARRLVVAKAAELARVPEIWHKEIQILRDAGVLVRRGYDYGKWDYVHNNQRRSFDTFSEALMDAISLVKSDPVLEAGLEVLESLLPLIVQMPEETPNAAADKAKLHRLALHALNTKQLPVCKIGRWTGYIQRALETAGLLSVAAERDRTRGIFHRAYIKAGIVVPSTFDASKGSKVETTEDKPAGNVS